MLLGKINKEVKRFILPPSLLSVLPINENVSEMYGQLCAALKKQPIGPNDTWIAAHALSLQLPLVTNNTREFSRVPGLVIDTWMNLK